MAAAQDKAAQDKTVRIGVLTDLSSLYSDITGAGSILAAEMAVELSGLRQKGWKIEIVSSDHQNKADVGSNIARQWYDTGGVDVIVDVPNSAVALAVSNLTRDKNRVFLNAGAATSDLTDRSCTPNTVHWSFDTYMLAHGTGSGMTKAGGDTWFFIAADYAFGASLERDTSAVVTALGGKVLGSVRHPPNLQDYSSLMLAAQASKAKVIGLANGGGDTINSVKQAKEFGIVQGGQKLSPLLMFITDVHALGLPIAQGLTFTESFYWDLNDGARQFSKAFASRGRNKAMPTMAQAGVASSLIHYLKALDAMGANSHDGAAIVAKMKEMPTDDPLFGAGRVRADGRKIHPAYLFEVKTPAESKGPWDYYKLVATIPAEEAFLDIAKSKCPLVAK
ncbi:ABC transporter substrate-binding protein [Xanthobacter dioxanivorans]|uniref:ABC transporter substrate-binding protein n=1 Tax=Xanthobacter dioxanivorans TaxID=2528964 RepID=A0A974SKF7_9HYPH|nr:ABC transporter substrate-binding protein [Xanthobacter dioxanivorans]QRG09431.1 ABC transporter substrate-binding protein [Xanthobacter dioxanivorans]